MRGRNEVKRIFDEKIKALTSDTAENAVRKMELEEKMKSLGNKGKKENIISFYRSKMSMYLKDLEVYSLSDDYKNITGSISDTGSSLSRALTAHYFSIFETIKGFSTSFHAPFIIDSPNQQAQDP